MSRDDPVTVSVRVEGWNSSAEDTVAIPRAEWEAMTVHQRREECDTIASVHAANYVSWGWHIEDPDDLAATQ